MPCSQNERLRSLPCFSQGRTRRSLPRQISAPHLRRPPGQTNRLATRHHQSGNRIWRNDRLLPGRTSSSPRQPWTTRPAVSPGWTSVNISVDGVMKAQLVTAAGLHQGSVALPVHLRTGQRVHLTNGDPVHAATLKGEIYTTFSGVLVQSDCDVWFVTALHARIGLRAGIGCEDSNSQRLQPTAAAAATERHRLPS